MTNSPAIRLIIQERMDLLCWIQTWRTARIGPTKTWEIKTPVYKPIKPSCNIKLKMEMIWISSTLMSSFRSPFHRVTDWTSARITLTLETFPICAIRSHRLCLKIRKWTKFRGMIELTRWSEQATTSLIWTHSIFKVHYRISSRAHKRHGDTIRLSNIDWRLIGLLKLKRWLKVQISLKYKSHKVWAKRTIINRGT